MHVGSHVGPSRSRGHQELHHKQSAVEHRVDVREKAGGGRVLLLLRLVLLLCGGGGGGGGAARVGGDEDGRGLALHPEAATATIEDGLQAQRHVHDIE